MRVLKFVFGGLLALFLISVVLKALFFLTFAALLLGGAFVARRAYLRMNGYPVGYQRQRMIQNRWQKQQPLIESIDDLVQRQQLQFFPNPRQQTASYREVELI